MNTGHPGCNQERDAEMEGTKTPRGVTADSRSGRGGRPGHRHHLQDAVRWCSHFTYSLPQILTHVIDEKPRALKGYATLPVTRPGNEGAETRSRTHSRAFPWTNPPSE